MSKMAGKPPLLPSKEASLFRHLVENYESKQYKKGIKAADQILKKHPQHGDTQAMKALILRNQGKSDEAFELCKLALTNAMQSNVCWHAYGLLWRSVKNYEEAMKAYRFALKLQPDSVQVQRDLVHLQAQMRDFSGMAQTRRTMLQNKATWRLNWTALAVALHLSGDLEGAEDILRRYEETLKQAPPRTDVEHSEALLYKNIIIAESGDYHRALADLETVYAQVLDRTAAMEMKADYQLRLGQREGAEQTYRAMLHRNTERKDYYHGLEAALGLDQSKSEDHEKLLMMYQGFANQSERVDAARRLPLDFLQGDAFREHADRYLRRMFAKGVPSTFANIKQLYQDDSKKQAFRELAEGYLKEGPMTGEVNGGASDGVDGSSPDTRATTIWQLSVHYFLAQHYDYHLSRDLTRAQQHVDQAVALNPLPSDYTYEMTRARIQKHMGAVQEAARTMDGARALDLRDRYINTKCAKYQLRADAADTATATMGLFTRPDAAGGPLGDLVDMQCVWFLTELGETELRRGRLALALRRLTSVATGVFDTWADDQFDFHGFSLRRGMVRAYVEMLRWQDGLRAHPFFTRAALGAVGIYCRVHDRPQLARDEDTTNGVGAATNAAEKKKIAKKARMEAERRNKAPATSSSAPDKPGAPNPPPSDLEEGHRLLRTATPLDDATKLLTQLLACSPRDPDVQIAAAEVYLRRRTSPSPIALPPPLTLTPPPDLPLPTLKSLVALHRLAPAHPRLHDLAGRLLLQLSRDDDPNAPPERIAAVVAAVAAAHPVLPVPLDPPASLRARLATHNAAHMAAHAQSAARVRAGVRLRRWMWEEQEEGKGEEAEEENVRLLVEAMEREETSLNEAAEGLAVLREGTGVGRELVERYCRAARGKWGEADLFRGE